MTLIQDKILCFRINQELADIMQDYVRKNRDRYNSDDTYIRGLIIRNLRENLGKMPKADRVKLSKYLGGLA